MLSQLVVRSPDLARLVEEGYDLELRDTNFLVHHIPYVTADRRVQYGILISELSVNGERTVRPGRHEMWLAGDVPHDHLGNRLPILLTEAPFDFGGGLLGQRMSAKRRDQHPDDYYIKVTTYANLLGQYARAVDPSATHRSSSPRESLSSESVFRYLDSATSRSALSAVTGKLLQDRIAIVGLGGTGSYILDLLAKTPVRELHLFDDDVFHAHNAFRSPGAASLEQLRVEPKKVHYLQRQYDFMRRNVIAHDVRISEGNVAELDEMDFIFVAVDGGPDKRLILSHLEAQGKAFIDCGIGVTRQDNALRGTVRTTSAGPGHYEHIKHRVSFADDGENEYDLNIQTADLNMFSALMAVIKWKKICGYYVDDKHEYNSTYAVARNQLVSGDLHL